jgi:hypothetical protein
MKLQKQKLNSRKMVLWLLNNMESDSGTISLKSGDEFPLKDKDVNLVLGIPYKGGAICRQRSTSAALLEKSELSSDASSSCHAQT